MKIKRRHLNMEYFPLMSVIPIVTTINAVVRSWNNVLRLEAELLVIEGDATNNWPKRRILFELGWELGQVDSKTLNWFVNIFKIINIWNSFVKPYSKQLNNSFFDFAMISTRMKNQQKMASKPVKWFWYWLHDWTKQSLNPNWKRKKHSRKHYFW